MKFRLFVAFLAAVAMTLTACGKLSNVPNSRIVILSPKPHTQLKIGETVTIQWACQDCEAVMAGTARVRLNARDSNSSMFNSLGVITTGFLSDSRPWTVGRYEMLYGPEPGPGFYYIEVSSYPPPNDYSWTEATSGFDGVLIELVQ